MHATQEKPGQPGFWSQRTGWNVLKQVLFLEPLPGGSRWAAAFGSLLLFAFMLQVITGVLLSMNYAPSVDSAWPSVKYIQEEVPLGAFIRSLHHWGSSAMVILLLLHLLQVFIWGAYKKPRELTWMVGVLLLLCTLGLAFTGYLLPWDEKAYWATKVGLGIASTTPVIGDGLRTVLQGGPQMGNLTLTRFFSIHTFVLPGSLILLVVVHLYLFRLHGVTPPWWESAAQLRAKEEPFWPKQLLKDGLVWLVFLVGLGWWCVYQPWGLGGHAPLEAQADPSQPYEARPEWYFMFYFQILRYFDGSTIWRHEFVVTLVLPLLFFLVLLFSPLLDRVLDWIHGRIWGWPPSRNPLRRPLAIGLLAAGTLVGLILFQLLRYFDGTTDWRDEGVGTFVLPLLFLLVLFFWPFLDRLLAGIQGRIWDWAPSRNPLRRPLAIALLVAGTFLGLNLVQLLRYFDGTAFWREEVVGTFVLPLLFFLVLFFWPFLDRGLDRIQGRIWGWAPSHNPLRRPLAMGLLGLGTFGLVGLTIFAIATDVRMTEPAQVLAKAPPAQPAGPIQRADVARIYNDNCAACHGVDGSGKQIRAGMPTIPDLTSMAWQMSQTELEIAHRIQDGNEPLMPAYRDKLTDKQILGLTIYIRAFKEEAGKEPAAVKPAPIPPIRAQMPSDQLYRNYCMGCHDADGRGQAMRSRGVKDIPDFSNPKLWGSEGVEAKFKEAILKGTGKLMVPMENKLGPEDAAELVKYIKKFREEKGFVVEVKPPVIPPSPVELVPKANGKKKGPKTSPELAARLRIASTLYRQYCLVCHGPDGKASEMKRSMPILAENDFSDPAWQNKVSDGQLEASILNGKGTLMPAFGPDRINAAQARDLVAYIRAFGPGRDRPADTQSPFEQRFRELQQQWDEFRRQFQELSQPPQKR
jgi:quinol-cytochrome oxidoreductase complex cytochrome b subunit/mono/diheme cytochrome c family protein